MPPPCQAPARSGFCPVIPPQGSYAVIDELSFLAVAQNYGLLQTAALCSSRKYVAIASPSPGAAFAAHAAIAANGLKSLTIEQTVACRWCGFSPGKGVGHRTTAVCSVGDGTK